VDRYCRYRQDVAKNDPITENGDLRALRRALKLADAAVAINEIPEGPGRERVCEGKTDAAPFP